ncbi:MAG TPA: ATP-binding cassette domain-containing protein [Methanosarcinaceae archaeon]|nr:ATP-binding cassette domain-containing protein [Methanosarcinaceae archaeon]
MNAESEIKTKVETDMQIKKSIKSQFIPESGIVNSHNTAEPIIEVRNLNYLYPGSKTRALNGVNFKIYPGARVVLLGANGSGKSTLFKHLNGILKPVSGEVLINGMAITKKNVKNARQTVGLVFQNPDDQIFAATVEQDVAFGPVNMGLPGDKVKSRVQEALELVGLAGFENRAPHHLSGGEKKRVAIAGILAMRPKIIVLDEPTSGLDPSSSNKILHLISKMNRDLGMTVILSTHNVDLVPMFAEWIYVMHGGKLEAEGTPKEIFSNSELIKKAHLRLPRIAKLMELLKEEGIDINVEITPATAKDELMRIIQNHSAKRYGN